MHTPVNCTHVPTQAYAHTPTCTHIQAYAHSQHGHTHAHTSTCAHTQSSSGRANRTTSLSWMAQPHSAGILDEIVPYNTLCTQNKPQGFYIQSVSLIKMSFRAAAWAHPEQETRRDFPLQTLVLFSPPQDIVLKVSIMAFAKRGQEPVASPSEFSLPKNEGLSSLAKMRKLGSSHHTPASLSLSWAPQRCAGGQRAGDKAGSDVQGRMTPGSIGRATFSSRIQ